MPIEPIKIPQNVQIEDRLIGPITLRQVAICLVGGGISFVIWSVMKKAGLVSIGHIAVAWTPLAIAAAFAFIKIQNLSLLRIILLLVEKAEKPRTRLWEPRTGIAINIRSYYKTQRDELPKVQSSIERDKLENLSAMLDKAMDEDGGKKKTAIEDQDNKNETTSEEQAKEYEAEVSDPQTENKETNRPVDRSRVSVEPRVDKSDSSVDGVSPAGQAPTDKSSPVIRDIS